MQLLAAAAGGEDALRTLFIQALAFLFLLYLLKRFVYPHLKGALVKRSEGIRETYEKIERDTAEIKAKTAEAQQKLAAISKEARRRMEAALEQLPRCLGVVVQKRTLQWGRASLERVRCTTERVYARSGLLARSEVAEKEIADRRQALIEAGRNAKKAGTRPRRPDPKDFKE